MRTDELPIADPCHEDWNTMEPREKARFCAACRIDVLDVSAMKQSEAAAFAKKPRHERMCVSYIVRKDGTIRFSDTPANVPDVPARSLIRRGRTLVAAAALSLAACQPLSDAAHAIGVSVAHADRPQTEVRLAGVAPMPPSPVVPDAGVPAPPAPRAPADKPTTSVPATTAPDPSARPESVPCSPRRIGHERPPEQRMNGGLSFDGYRGPLD